MIAMSIAEIADLVDGEAYGDGGIQVTGPATVDSRAVQPGGLFVALVGERVDGHDFAVPAITAGAAAVLGSRPLGVPMVVVDDPRVALSRLAHHVLSTLDDLTVVALTGSQGKTTTKDLLAHVLAELGPTVATHGSFNNEIGLPLTVLRIEAETRYLVLEMGARGIGHIRDLCRIAPPDVAAVLNVGKAHLGEFGTQADIALAKGEIVEALPAGGIAVLNADDPLVAAMESRTAAAVVTFGQSAACRVRLSQIEVDARGRASFELRTAQESARVTMQLVGEHQAGNAAAAAAVAVGLGMPLAQAATALSRVTHVSRWRMELHERADGVLVINDAYNANPDSMRAALRTLSSIGRNRGSDARTIAVLGEMRELGASSHSEHDIVGRLAVRLGIDWLVVVGAAARPIHLGACQESPSREGSVFVEDSQQALVWLRDHVRPGDAVLLKASRAVGLEVAAAALLGEVDGPGQSGSAPQ